jgi:hypothetical protein
MNLMKERQLDIKMYFELRKVYSIILMSNIKDCIYIPYLTNINPKLYLLDKSD